MRNVFGLIVLLVICGQSAAAQHWPQWRGPTQDGVSTETGLPVTWSATCADTGRVGDDESVGGPFVAGEVAPEQRGGQRGGNFQGRPVVPTVCANIEKIGRAHV